jgi:hypothetical protein
MDRYIRDLKNFYIAASVGRAIRVQLQPILLEPIPQRIVALMRKLALISPRTANETNKRDKS